MVKILNAIRHVTSEHVTKILKNIILTSKDLENPRFINGNKSIWTNSPKVKKRLLLKNLSKSQELFKAFKLG